MKQSKIAKTELIKAVSGEYRTLEDIGNQFGVTRERVRQVIIRQKPDKKNKRITCSYCNEKVELGKNNQPKKAHPECVESAIWSEPTCHICNTTFKIRTKVINRQMARRTSAWTKGIIFCSKSCYGRYLGSSFGKGAQAITKNYTKRYREVKEGTVHTGNVTDEIKSLESFGYGSV